MGSPSHAQTDEGVARARLLDRLIVLLIPSGDLLGIGRRQEMFNLTGLKANMQPFIAGKEQGLADRKMAEQLHFSGRELKHLLQEIKRGGILSHQHMGGTVGGNRAVLKNLRMLTDHRDTQIVLPGSPDQIFEEE